VELPEGQAGELVSVRVTGRAGDRLVGEVAA
jgi:hypothetical protein